MYWCYFHCVVKRITFCLLPHALLIPFRLVNSHSLILICPMHVRDKGTTIFFSLYLSLSQSFAIFPTSLHVKLISLSSDSTVLSHVVFDFFQGVSIFGLMWYAFLGHSVNVAEPSDPVLLCLDNCSTMLIINILEHDAYNVPPDANTFHSQFLNVLRY